MRGLPDREPGLGLRVQRIVALLGVFRHTQELRRARVVRAVDHDGQLERETGISDETRGERKHERVFAEEREHRETHAGEREVQFEMGGEVSREVEGESGRERALPSAEKCLAKLVAVLRQEARRLPHEFLPPVGCSGSAQLGLG